MRFFLGAGLALLMLGGCMTALAPLTGGARRVGVYEWPVSDHGLGGFSGLELAADGLSLTAVSDRGRIVTARIDREQGRISQVSLLTQDRLWDEGRVWLPTEKSDAEGLAIGPDGVPFVSFEGSNRVAGYAHVKMPEVLPGHPEFKDMPSNGGFEALAMDAEGRLLAIPERSGKLTEPFPVWRFEQGQWQVTFRISRTHGFLPVGADLGPDGMLYVLERAFNGFGFASRVRRFALDRGGVQPGEPILRTGLWDYDNLEGLSVWADSSGAIRLTMISDDNFRAIQKTQLVEYALTGR